MNVTSFSYVYDTGKCAPHSSSQARRKDPYPGTCLPGLCQITSYIVAFLHITVTKEILLALVLLHPIEEVEFLDDTQGDRSVPPFLRILLLHTHLTHTKSKGYRAEAKGASPWVCSRGICVYQQVKFILFFLF